MGKTKNEKRSEFSLRDAHAELQQGIIGMHVWGYVLQKAGYTTKQIEEYTKHIPCTEQLLEISRNGSEKIVTTIGEMSSAQFWEKLGFKITHNANTAGFSWDQFFKKNLCESGVYVVNIEGSHSDKPFHEQLEAVPEGYEITQSGVQMVAEFAHAFCFGNFLNPNHMVRCVDRNEEGKEILVSVGGGEQSFKKLRFYRDGVLPSRLAKIGVQRKVFSVRK